MPSAFANRRGRRRRFLTRRFLTATTAAFLVGTLGIAVACPFCESVQQTIRQQSMTMDAVAIASSLNGEATRNLTTGAVRMRIEKVLKGGEFVKVGQEFDAIYYGQVDVGRRFLISGVDPPKLQWSCLPVSKRAEEYIVKGSQLPEDRIEQLKFFRHYLEDEETLISRDAYDEFASTSYDIIRELGPEMDRERLIRWVKLPDLVADRKRLYFTMLGVCGTKEDLPMLEEMLKEPKLTNGGLDALIACYLTLAGESGLPLINELFIENRKAPFPDSYAAIMAIRFHGTDGDVISKNALAPSLHKVLERSELADMVIPDLAKWNDWSQIDRVVKLFKEAEQDKNWVRVPVINYLRACPKPEAAEAMAELRKIDPDAVRRAETFFPVIPSPSNEESSAKEGAQVPTAGMPTTKPGEKYAQVELPKIIPDASGFVADAPNRWRLGCVIVVALTTVMLSVFLVLTGGASSETVAS